MLALFYEYHARLSYRKQPPVEAFGCRRQQDQVAKGPAATNGIMMGGGRVPNKKQKELYVKWQAAAVEMGGPDARIVVDAAIAKKMILQFLGEQASRPVSLVQIYRVRIVSYDAVLFSTV